MTRCVIGMCCRVSFTKWIGAPAWIFTFNPIIKALLTTNVWLWDLEVKWCNQWTDPFWGCQSDVLQGVLVELITHCKPVTTEMSGRIDATCFCGHYAHPLDPLMATSVGLQFAPGLLNCNMTRTTHMHLGTMKGFKPESETGNKCIFAVELYGANLWHILTGYVEVNIQEDHDGPKLEHPMWILMPADGHVGNKLYDWVNNLFARFAPQLYELVLGDIDAHVRNHVRIDMVPARTLSLTETFDRLQAPHRHLS